jgi:hypothetical protein
MVIPVFNHLRGINLSIYKYLIFNNIKLFFGVDRKNTIASIKNYFNLCITLKLKRLTCIQYPSDKAIHSTQSFISFHYLRKAYLIAILKTKDHIVP